MTATEAFAPAKINLTLHVTGQRPDGYHLLDSLVVFADVGDRIWLTPGPDMSLEVFGPFAVGVPTDARNLLWQAAERAGLCGAIRLEKNLPHGAGIGGGSADAAALLRSQFGDDVARGIGIEAALSLGADVPVCLHAGPQRMQGIGERLSRPWPIPGCAIVLVNPGVEIATADVFGALDRKDNPPMDDIPRTRDFAAFIAWLADQRNDLQGTAMTLAPAMADTLDALSDAALARMSGSGATCFGLYATDEMAAAAATRISNHRPDWWVHEGRFAGARAD